MLSVFCFTEFAVEIPVAGGSFAYFRVELGDLAAFIAAGNIIFESVFGGAMVARSWTSYFATLLNHSPDDFCVHTNLPSDFNLLDPIAVVVILLASLTHHLSTRLTSQLNWISTALNTIIILFIITAGFIKGNPSNLSPFLPYAVMGVFRATVVIYFAYGGFDVITTMAEETKNPSKDIPLGLLGSMSGVTVIYCLMALALVLMQSYTVLDVNAAYSLAFQSIGWKWAKYVVALGSLKGITTVLLVGAVKRGRYLTHIARTHVIPPWFGLVSMKTGTPVNGTAFMAIASASLAFFSRLDVLSKLRAISVLFIYTLLFVALLVRRHYLTGKTSASQAFLLTTFIVVIICSSIGTSAYWGLSSGSIGYCIMVPIWFLATAGLAVFVPQCREAKVWGAPMVPWVPSLSIFINVFLMGSVDYESFIRFGVCTIVMLVYYAFFGLHASFDAVYCVGDN
ncbi:cationic amino acid transporter 5-like [Cryptomeria japonica]|uniref:cationic amino acid transporter 5-like n=1 Tax=Cryptomeria japonica TaxID=3369 RepID=UPI0025AC132A|nr:cationic amino acid transporter 5-like [Cryptomeria japonica]